jgi:hypothetical protein
MSIDANRYPITARYLAHLPSGLDSHPTCLVKTDAHDGLREEFPTIGQDKGLPAIVQDFFNGHYRETWLPEVVGSTLVHLVRDVSFKNDDEYEAWAFENNSRLFKKPHYRVLMYIMSVTLLINGAAKRWNSLHQGSTVVADPVVKDGANCRSCTVLTFPPRVFDEIDMRNIGSGYRAAMTAVKAEQPSVVWENLTDSGVEFIVRWRV